MKEQIESFVKDLARLLEHRKSMLSEEDLAYFEGKKFAYECVLELIEQESK